MKTLKKVLRIILTILLVVVLAFGALLGFLSLTEYKPEDVEALTVQGKAVEEVVPNRELSILDWNIGYGALGDNADFFMDGGTSVKTADTARTEQNLNTMVDALNTYNSDFLFLQEVDLNSERSNYINELDYIASRLPQEYNYTFANNFKVAFLPYPIPPIGKVDSGITTFSKYAIQDAKRIQLPIPFAWPVRMANLKRCLNVTRYKVQGTNAELVLVNLHLEAYDTGEGKRLQTLALRDLLQEERKKGNYVIAGGDFNQFFSGVDLSKYPTLEGKWQCGEIHTSMLADAWNFIMDPSVPTCRSLDQSYVDAVDKDPSVFQYYMIDGYICSNNIEIHSYQTLDYGFTSTDHNPVYMTFSLH